MYVLICSGNGSNDGKYVAQPGSQFSYTNNLRLAQRFPTEAKANADKCGNETAVTVESQLQRPS